MSFDFLDTEQVTYDLRGDTLAEAAEEIAEKDESAQTEWFPQYSYTTTGQELSSAAVTVKTTITMPRWRGYDSAPVVDQREWDRFLVALQAHERGHVDLVLQHLCNIDERLVGESPAGARRIWDAALAALKAASDAYDRDTDHGRNQGTIIDVSGVTPAAG